MSEIKMFFFSARTKKTFAYTNKFFSCVNNGCLTWHLRLLLVILTLLEYFLHLVFIFDNGSSNRKSKKTKRILHVLRTLYYHILCKTNVKLIDEYVEIICIYETFVYNFLCPTFKYFTFVCVPFSTCFFSSINLS